MQHPVQKKKQLSKLLKLQKVDNASLSQNLIMIYAKNLMNAVFAHHHLIAVGALVKIVVFLEEKKEVSALLVQMPVEIKVGFMLLHSARL